MAIQVLVCGEEEAAVAKCIALLQSQQTEAPVEVVGCSCPEKLKDKTLPQFQLMFLGVAMKACNGMEIARRIRELRLDTVLILISSNLQYAKEGYEVGAFRFIERGEDREGETLIRYYQEAIHLIGPQNDTLEFSVNREHRSVKWKEIVYLESLQRKIYLHTDEKQNDASFYSTMEKIENQLEGNGFLRVHRSYLVNLRYVDDIRSSGTILTNGKTLPVSQKRFPELRQIHLQFKQENRGPRCQE